MLRLAVGGEISAFVREPRTQIVVLSITDIWHRQEFEDLVRMSRNLS